MYNFDYRNPVHIVFGRDRVDELQELIAPWGKKILLVYGGGSIKRTGLYERIMKQLKAAGKEVLELSGVMPNPRTEKVYEGIEICKREKIDFLLAVGGGSVIDCCKAISVGAKIDGDFWETFYVNWTPAEDAIPLGTVLTIPATGSEMDMSSVITRWDTSEKNSYDSPLTYPKFSILDPVLTFTLPKNQMVNGIVDTMSHIFELYFSPPDEENVTDSLAEGLLRSLIRSARIAIKNPTDYDARADLMWTSCFALCGMLNNGKKTDWASHCIEHPISALFDVAHGAGLAVVHPAYLDYVRGYAPARFARFARNVWGIDPAGKSEEEQGAEGVRCVRAFFRELGAPETLADLKVGEKDLERIAELTDLSCWSYKKLSREDVIAILRSAL